MTTPAVTQADANLWAAYGNKLKSQFLQSATMGADERFYIAPLSAAGIAAGKNIDETIKNMGVFTVADTLLDLDSPIFMPSRQSYSKRASQFANQVFLDSDGNQGAQAVYNDAQAGLIKAAEYFQTTKDRALADWTQDTKMNNLRAAAAKAAAASAAIAGPNAAALGQIQSGLNQALTGNASAGYNMTCSPASANQIAASQTGSAGPGYLNPAYTIDAQYSANVDNWISTFAQNKDKPASIIFKASDASNSSWENLGYSSSSVSVTGSYCIFFSATYTENNTTVTKHMTAEEAGSDMEITLTCTGISTYNLTPGNKWNPAQLFGMPLIKNSDQSLWKSAAYVSQAVLAYGVGMSIKMSSSTSSAVNDYISKARTTGGSVSIFGYNIGLGGDVSSTNTSTTTYDQVKSTSSGSVINIPASNNAYPTLLAVMGKAIPPPSNLAELLKSKA